MTRLLLFLALATLASAQVPRTLRFQGRAEEGGSPASGTASATFRLHDAETGGSEVASEVVSVSFDEAGVFRATLGETSPVAFGALRQPLWADVDLGAGATPRTTVPAVPYAIYAGTADSLATRVVSVFHDGDDAAAGQALRDALAGLADGTADKRYLVRLSPGTYAVGTPTLDVPAYVTLQGAGEEATFVSGGSSPTFSAGVATVFRDLSLSCSTTTCVNLGNPDVRMDRIRLRLVGTFSSQFASGIVVNFGAPGFQLTRSRVELELSGSAIGRAVFVTGTFTPGDEVTIRDTEFVIESGGLGDGVRADAPNVTVRLWNSPIWTDSGSTSAGIRSGASTAVVVVENGVLSAPGANAINANTATVKLFSVQTEGALLDNGSATICGSFVTDGNGDPVALGACP